MMGRRPPYQFRWPVHDDAVVVNETGRENDGVLRSLAQALYAAGTVLIVVIRLTRIHAGLNPRLCIDLVAGEIAV